MKTNKKIWIYWGVLSVLIIIGAIIWLASIPSPEPVNTVPNTIKLSVDEDFFDVNNLKEIHFADVYVINGRISWKEMGGARSADIETLKKALTEINSRESLPLMYEPELGRIMSMDVLKNDSNYIYAVAEYLGNEGFSAEVTSTNIMLPNCNVLIAGNEGQVIC